MHFKRLAVVVAMVLATLALLTVDRAADAEESSDSEGTPGSERLLPDLVQIAPGTVEIHTRRSSRGTRTLLAFAASAENHGTGPLIIRGSRFSRRTAAMRADQLIRRADGSFERIRGVGRLHYQRSADHRHWHLDDFMRYELRDGAGRLIGNDRKTGFCLGDRYERDTSTDAPGEPDSPVYTSRCGLSKPHLTRLTQGISIGYGDDYPAFLEGQYIDVTGLPSGRYVLIQRVNADGRLAELYDDNNIASMAVSFLQRGTRSRARILDWCREERCPTPD